MASPAERTVSLGATVFSEFSALAAKHGAVNLGQGFPDFDGPAELHEAAHRAMREGKNQYAIAHGAQPLRSAIAVHLERFRNVRADPETEITVTSGATEAIFDALMAWVNPGDEVVLFEPFYDSYPAGIRMAGGVPRCVRLEPPASGDGEWTFDPAALEAAFSPRTRAVVVNTPHNPTGKVFRRDELERIATLCRKHDAVLISDEVYEHLVYPGITPVWPAQVAGLADRTVSISSAGKTFSLTGWKIGWAIAPPLLTRALRQVHQFVTFATSSPFQVAVAEALALPDAYFQGQTAAYLARRDFLLERLRALGFTVWTPSGSTFVLAGIPGVDDRAFCQRLTTEAGVAAIPLSPFFDPSKPPPPARVRFAFCKRRETLEEAARRLERWTGMARGDPAPVSRGTF